MIVPMLIDRFKRKEVFLKEFWHAAEFMATLEEKEQDQAIKDSGLKMLKYSLKKLITVKESNAPLEINGKPD